MTEIPFLVRIHRDRSGVSTTEFGILIGLFALASLQAISAIGSEVSEDFDHASTKVGAADMLGPLGGNGPIMEPPIAGDQSGPIDEPAVAGAAAPTSPTSPNGPVELDPIDFEGPIDEPPTAASKAMAE